MAVTVVEARVIKPGNDTLSLGVRVHGPLDELIDGPGWTAAKVIAMRRGFDPEGATRAGMPTLVGDGHGRIYRFYDCACHHDEACGRVARKVAWTDRSHGSEPDAVAYADLGIG